MGKNDQNVTQKNEPWKKAAPYLEKLMKETNTLYGKQKKVGTVYGGPRVAGFSDPTQTAMGMVQQRASSGPGSGLTGAQSAVSGMIGAGGGSAGLNSALSRNQGAAARTGNESGVMARLVSQATADPAKNPFLDQIIQQNQDDAANQIAARFSASGRYGSDAMGRSMAGELGRIGTEARYRDYEANMARRDAANRDILSGENTLQGRAMGAAQFDAGAQQDMLNRVLQSSQLAGQLDQQNFDQESAKTAQMLGIGQMQDTNAQAKLDAARAQFDETNQEPWKKLGLAMNIFQPNAQAFSTSTQNSTGGGPGIGQSLMGGGLAFLSLLPKLAALPMFSDENLKEDITPPLGWTDDGIPIRAFSYSEGGPLGLKKKSPMVTGVLAQEAAKKRPDAVARDPSGYLKVNYGAL